MANSHLGMASDGRYIYYIWEPGLQCRGPAASTFVLDTVTEKWESLPPLPAPRYDPATQIWRGRLHVISGSKENRYTPGVDHWSLLVKNGKAVGKQWQKEVPIPRGGPHRACGVVDEKLYVLGGQEGDFMATQGHLYSNVLGGMRFGWYIEHPYLAGARIQAPAMVCYWKASIYHIKLQWLASGMGGSILHLDRETEDSITRNQE